MTGNYLGNTSFLHRSSQDNDKVKTINISIPSLAVQTYKINARKFPILGRVL